MSKIWAYYYKIYVEVSLDSEGYWKHYDVWRKWSCWQSGFCPSNFLKYLVLRERSLITLLDINVRVINRRRKWIHRNLRSKRRHFSIENKLPKSNQTYKAIQQNGIVYKKPSSNEATTEQMKAQMMLQMKLKVPQTRLKGMPSYRDRLIKFRLALQPCVSTLQPEVNTAAS